MSIIVWNSSDVLALCVLTDCVSFCSQVHHGGAGTTAAGLTAAVSLVLVIECKLKGLPLEIVANL